ncbi:hypothetical protein DWF00_07635 [Bosea caraganae]|uniref:Uncharacterized protein n=1 Tax=Bosea caraganae TaxID=2763117 RepID=A0A370L135_9HYPH|nr:hypothetical protein [Bosea caraganae]RDJ21082.1 hypothetical protein DWE98_22430 [Bosea caraganae]RDJ28581.1 hypothetical protein DWF00_07635 [Bosea caraganae]
MSKDTMSGGGNSNSPADAPMSEAFNRQNELAAQVANMSPAAQEKVRMIRELSAQRLEAEKRKQHNSHEYRVLKQKVELLTNYIRDPAPRPAEIRADPSPDLKIIDDQAERMVADKETFYRRHIEREAEANIRQVVVSERKGPDFRRDQPNHDREPEY